MDSNPRFRNSRIQKMLDHCHERSRSELVIKKSSLLQEWPIGESEKENQPPMLLPEPVHGPENNNHLEIVQDMAPKEQFSVQFCDKENHSKCPNLPMEVTLVNSLYAREYSLTSSIFNEFGETKTHSDQSLKSIEGLICHEIMLPMSMISSAPDSPVGDFSSDDSVKDKDYCPSEESDLSDDDHISRVKCNKKQPTNAHPITQQTEPNITEQPEVFASSSEIATAEEQINDIIIFNAKERKIQQKQQKRLTYNVKPGCNIKCSKKCSTKFSEDTRAEINKYYWDLSWQERRVFMRNSTAVAIPKRKITAEPKRAPRSTFNFKKSDGTQVEVCKIFFLTTLGFHKNNDTVLYNSLNKIEKDRRGLHTKTPRIDRDILTSHVESFHPLELHYRREHAPLRRYLPCDVTIKLMHKDFCEKNPSQKVSYELYRKHVNSMRISFTKLGNEECEICESYFLHSKSTTHDVKNAIPENCGVVKTKNISEEQCCLVFATSIRNG
ncbi:uncharacterized protein LOC128673864 [Plodia interpunctella]|uniref:uncharacterized protein LOC128673864 n=1 Tax=Plodia interpunctella TaxID=58824 RepID=UPI002368376C|nr:uncharacterized protein LOC128673864 [Plodia interpunctella]